MVYQGINLENVKVSNRTAILRLLNNNGAMSRKDIAESVGLTAASVTLICNELLEEGIIHELGEVEEEKRAGRKKILLDINADYKNVLCIGIESDETYISITNIKGTVICSSCMDTEKDISAEDFLKKVTGKCRELLWEQDIPKKSLLGASVTLPGKVDRKNGISLGTYSIWNEEVPVAKIIEDSLGLKVVVENNLKAYAEAEIVFGRGRASDNLFLVKWGPGVGSAMIIDQRVYQGAGGMAGEFGHMTSGKTGKLCKCGRYGCLETEVSTHAIISDIMDAYEESKRGGEKMEVLDEWLSKGNVMTYRNTAEWGALSDKKLQEILDRKIDLISHRIRNAVSLLDPDKVIVLGYLFEIPGAFDRIRKAFAEYDPTRPSDYIVQSELTERVSHTEGLSVLLDELLFGSGQMNNI